tara:strand:- start:185 stop:976 length:792 start_codon:yes stop_codon:yes gene_type:complete
MSALSRLGVKTVESVVDFLSSFSDKVFYHGSLSPDIEEFKQSGEFFHFGTPEAAYERLRDLRSVQDQGRSSDMVGSIYPVRLKAERPLTLEENTYAGSLSSWNANNIWDRISSEIGISGATPPNKNNKQLAVSKYGISSDELNTAKVTKKYKKPDGKTFTDNRYFAENFQFNGVPFGEADEIYPGGKDRWIIDFLNSKGFDSIQYVNKGEDPGSMSTIVLEPNQVRSQFANFDPAQAKSGKILASVPLAAGALSSLSTGEQDE